MSLRLPGSEHGVRLCVATIVSRLKIRLPSDFKAREPVYVVFHLYLGEIGIRMHSRIAPQLKRILSRPQSEAFRESLAARFQLRRIDVKFHR